MYPQAMLRQFGKLCVALLAAAKMVDSRALPLIKPLSIDEPPQQRYRRVLPLLTRQETQPAPVPLGTFIGQTFDYAGSLVVCALACGPFVLAYTSCGFGSAATEACLCNGNYTDAWIGCTSCIARHQDSQSQEQDYILTAQACYLSGCGRTLNLGLDGFSSYTAPVQTTTRSTYEPTYSLTPAITSATTSYQPATSSIAPSPTTASALTATMATTSAPSVATTNPSTSAGTKAELPRTIFLYLASLIVVVGIHTHLLKDVYVLP